MATSLPVMEASRLVACTSTQRTGKELHNVLCEYQVSFTGIEQEITTELEMAGTGQVKRTRTPIESL